MVARALLLQPRLIIADEPVSMVDASLRATILESLRQLHLQFGISHALHHPRPDHRLPDQPEHHRHVPRRGGRGRRRRSGRQAAAAPVHPTADPVDPAGRSQSPLAGSRSCRGPVGAGRRWQPEGCKFADRCPHVMDICRQQPRRSSAPTSIAPPPASSTGTAPCSPAPSLEQVLATQVPAGT